MGEGTWWSYQEEVEQGVETHMIKRRHMTHEIPPVPDLSAVPGGID